MGLKDLFCRLFQHSFRRHWVIPGDGGRPRSHVCCGVCKYKGAYGEVVERCDD